MERSAGGYKAAGSKKLRRICWNTFEEFFGAANDADAGRSFAAAEWHYPRQTPKMGEEQTAVLHYSSQSVKSWRLPGNWSSV
jgi:hypothetical protein